MIAPRNQAELLRKYGMSIWASGIGAFSRKNTDADHVGFRATTGGGVLGFDLGITDRMIIGFLFGGSMSNVNFEGVPGDGKLDNVTGGVYAAYYGNRWFANASFTYGMNFVESNRNLMFGTTNTVSRGKTEGRQIAAHGRAGLLVVVRQDHGRSLGLGRLCELAPGRFHRKRWRHIQPVDPGADRQFAAPGRPGAGRAPVLGVPERDPGAGDPCRLRARGDGHQPADHVELRRGNPNLHGDRRPGRQEHRAVRGGGRSSITRSGSACSSATAASGRPGASSTTSPAASGVRW